MKISHRRWPEYYNIFARGDTPNSSDIIVFTNGALGKSASPTETGNLLANSATEVDVFLFNSVLETGENHELAFNMFLQAVGPDVRLHRPGTTNKLEELGGKFLTS